eukprot:763179-Hanusia_phi.AAC.10
MEQMWLRCATELEYLRGFPDELKTVTWHEKVRRLEEVSRVSEPDLLPRPFASPYYWAGYSVWGDAMCSGKHNVTAKTGGYDYSKAADEYLQSVNDV